MNIDLKKIDIEFEWVKKVIDSVKSPSQISSCENLIHFFKIQNWNDDFSTDEEKEYNSFITSLEQHLNLKKEKYQLID
jgi:endonuclease IV